MMVMIAITITEALESHTNNLKKTDLQAALGDFLAKEQG